MIRFPTPVAVDRLLYQRNGGQFRRLVGLTCHFRPASWEAYRRYLPAALGMPRLPVVKVFLIDYLDVRPWPFRRYQEWSILLRARHGAIEGWFPVTMPVTSRIARQGGYHLGFPKHVAEHIALVVNGTHATGAVRSKGIDVVMEFEPGTVPCSDPFELSFHLRDHVVPDPLLVLKPVGIGPEVQCVRFVDVVEPSWQVHRGVMRIRGDAGNLIPHGVALAGSLHAFSGGMNLAVVSGGPGHVGQVSPNRSSNSPASTGVPGATSTSAIVPSRSA